MKIHKRRNCNFIETPLKKKVGIRKKYRAADKAHKNELVRQRRLQDEEYRIFCHIRSRIRLAVKSQNHTKSAKQLR